MIGSSRSPKALIARMLITLFLSAGMGPGFSLSAQAAPPAVELGARAKAKLQSGEYPLLENVGSILEKVSKLRQLPIKESVKVDTLSREELLAFLRKEFEADLNPKEAQGEEALYTRWGLFTADFNYAEFMLGLYTEQIGGFYDPKTRKLYLLEGMSLSKLDQEVLVAHELTHALQDQSFGLKNYLEVPKQKEPNGDRQLALMALIEGDASLTSAEYVQGLMQSNFNLMDMLGSLANAVRMNFAFEKLREAPRVIRESLVFPYDQGMRFVQSFRKEGWSWEEINTLYKNPPRSSEQILQPAKYLDGENPSPRHFKTQPTWPDQWPLMTRGVMGEWGWRHYFLHYLEAGPARSAARGWAGDHYQVYQSPNRPTEKKPARLLFNTLWDSPEEAQEFANAYLLTLQKRYPSLTFPAQFQALKLIALGPQDHLLIYQQGPRCLIAEGLPALTPTALKALEKTAFQ